MSSKAAKVLGVNVNPDTEGMLILFFTFQTLSSLYCSVDLSIYRAIHAPRIIYV